MSRTRTQQRGLHVTRPFSSCNGGSLAVARCCGDSITCQTNFGKRVLGKFPEDQAHNGITRTAAGGRTSSPPKRWAHRSAASCSPHCRACRGARSRVSANCRGHATLHCKLINSSAFTSRKRHSGDAREACRGLANLQAVRAAVQCCEHGVAGCPVCKAAGAHESAAFAWQRRIIVTAALCSTTNDFVHLSHAACQR